jgi:hypothetical protein
VIIEDDSLDLLSENSTYARLRGSRENNLNDAQASTLLSVGRNGDFSAVLGELNGRSRRRAEALARLGRTSRS